ncbi:MAG TPA: Rieske 2Fe-2S domain-containing protein [Candidatus Polarisedimenticolaceae bacterium]|nr:Rieske 2Fe-2S domain-containing protein [Candidatus Polarisedimenticolaceae bacterium]
MRQAVPRRRFLDLLLGGSVASLVGAALYPVLRYLSPPRAPEAASKRVLAGTVSELAKDGWKIFPFGAEAGILIEKAPHDYVALSATCTHLECTVQYERASKRIWCACHNGYYDLTGRNVAGPPPRPLTPYTVQLVGDEIYVSRG